jgi:hypothetical protein
LWAALSVTLLWGCGDDDDSRFGDPDALRAYRAALNPVIDEVSEIEVEVTERAVGSSNAATAENLNAVYTDMRPRLLEALVELDRLQPPRRLQALHADIRQLILLRLDAYRIVMDGYAAQDTTVYMDAEIKLQQANERIVDINLVLCQIDEDLGAVDACRLLASRGRERHVHLA